MLKLPLTLVVALAVGSGFGASTAQAHKQHVSWATLEQRANTLIALGAVHSTRHGDASPVLKYIETQMIYMKFGKDAPRAWCYANRESGLNPGAISSTDDHSLFQINRSAHSQQFDFARLDRPEVGYGITAAWRLYRGAGWQPWAGGSYPCPQGNEPKGVT